MEDLQSRVGTIRLIGGPHHGSVRTMEHPTRTYECLALDGQHWIAVYQEEHEGIYQFSHFRAPTPYPAD